MRCIFCKQDSSSSLSVEHIIPESLWNTLHVLPRGIVCDTCNNYFARKIEKPFLDSPAIKRLRFEQRVPSKRGRIPTTKAYIYPDIPVELFHYDQSVNFVSKDGEKIKVEMGMEVPRGAFKHLFANTGSQLLVLDEEKDVPSESIVSRLLAKMAVEAMAYQLQEHAGGLNYIVDELQFDPIRRFARFGIPREWPHHLRRIYPSDRLNFELNGSTTQTVHEFDFLVTKKSEWFFVFALFGTELVINLGCPEIDGYIEWLVENNGACPLYLE